MPQIFISYKREKKTDEIYLNTLIAEIEKLSYEPWYDREKIRGGESWRQSIEDALENSFVCLVIVTDNIFESDWMFFEVAFALGLGIHVIPWYVDGEPKKHDSAFGTLLNEIEGIKDVKELKEKLERIKHNYIADFLNEEIAQITLRPRVLCHIACAYLEYENFANAEKWFDILWRELFQFEKNWQNLLLQYNSLINRKQKRVINELIYRFSMLNGYCASVTRYLGTHPRKNPKQVVINSRVLLAYLKDLDLYIEKSLIYNADYHKEFLDSLVHLKDKFAVNVFSPFFFTKILNDKEFALLPILSVGDIPF